MFLKSGGKKCGKFYAKAYVRSVFACEIKPPQKRCLGVKRHRTVTIDEEVKTLCERAAILYFAYIHFHVNVVCTMHHLTIRI